MSILYLTHNKGTGVNPGEKEKKRGQFVKPGKTIITKLMPGSFHLSFFVLTKNEKISGTVFA